MFHFFVELFFVFGSFTLTRKNATTVSVSFQRQSLFFLPKSYWHSKLFKKKTTVKFKSPIPNSKFEKSRSLYAGHLNKRLDIESTRERSMRSNAAVDWFSGEGVGKVKKRGLFFLLIYRLHPLFKLKVLIELKLWAVITCPW